MKRNNGLNKQKIQIGTSSMLLIFTVLCLVIFSTLSLASANADYTLAIKNEKNVIRYYQVDSKGEELKKQVNKQLITLAVRAENKEEFIAFLKETFKESFNEKDSLISYTIDAGCDQVLIIQLKVNDYAGITEAKQNYKVTSWIIQNKVDYEVDNNMPVWSGI